MKSKITYKQFFFSMLRLSACTFGGGHVIVALMKNRFVDDLQWITEDEMLDFTAIAQSSPGAVAVNASVLVGYYLLGLPGALTGIMGTILPPFFILSLISVFYNFFRDNEMISIAFTGILAGVAAILLHTVIQMFRSMQKKKNHELTVIMILSFIAVYFFDFNLMFVILICVFIGAFHCKIQLKDRRRKEQ